MSTISGNYDTSSFAAGGIQGQTDPLSDRESSTNFLKGQTIIDVDPHKKFLPPTANVSWEI